LAWGLGVERGEDTDVDGEGEAEVENRPIQRRQARTMETRCRTIVRWMVLNRAELRSTQRPMAGEKRNVAKLVTMPLFRRLAPD